MTSNLTCKERSILTARVNQLYRIQNQLYKLRSTRVFKRLEDADGHTYDGDIDCALASIEMILQDITFVGGLAYVKSNSMR